MTTSEAVSPSYSFYPFSTSTLNDILGKFSELSLKNIILGYMFMVSNCYSFKLSFFCFCNFDGFLLFCCTLSYFSFVSRFQLIYVAVTLMQWKDPVRSQTGVGIAGVLLLSITVAAGLGFCALLGDYYLFFFFWFLFYLVSFVFFTLTLWLPKP